MCYIARAPESIMVDIQGVASRAGVRRVIGLALIVFGFAHAQPGSEAYADAAYHALNGAGWALVWVLTGVWVLAMPGFVAAGLGLAGVRPFRYYWPQLTTLATLASLVLLAGFPSAWALPGGIIDLVVLAGVLLHSRLRVTAGVRMVSVERRRVLRGVGVALAVLLVGYVVLVLATRPWFARWGATDAELRQPLPGDELAPGPRFVERAVTINAPPAAVWPWLVQMGQDRAGFYSYDFLENLLLAGIHNADRIVPQWQGLKAGDHVRLAAKEVYGDRPLVPVVSVDPGHSIVLQGWGAFVIAPADSGRTRFVVRSRVPPGPSRLSDLARGIPAVLVYDPLHFLMERRMLLGVKERAEDAWWSPKRPPTLPASADSALPPGGAAEPVDTVLPPDDEPAARRPPPRATTSPAAAPQATDATRPRIVEPGQRG
jgi:hypothetical protein